MFRFAVRCLVLTFTICLSISVYSSDIKSSIVKVTTTSNSYNYKAPWLPPSQDSKTGTGFVVDKHRIITNAHVVANAAYVEVRLAQRSKRYEVKIKAIGHDCDLAVLEPIDDDFFDNVKPLKFGNMPKVQQHVDVFGFPIGGNELSITQGIVSRIESQEYSHGGVMLPIGQIDAAINPGNSGGPVMSEGQVVGVAHQGMTGGQNIGYMIPISIVKHFLKDAEENGYQGFPGIGIQIQPMENPDIRDFYQMRKERTGILVSDLAPDSPAEKVLKVGDIILEIDGTNIENDGTVITSGVRLSASSLILKKFMGESVSIKILRAGEEQDVEVPVLLTLRDEFLVPRKEFDKAPDYYIFAGIVFQPLTQNYLETYGDNWIYIAPRNFLADYFYGKKTRDQRQIIIINRVLSNSLNMGYQGIHDRAIKKVNGQNIGDMRDLITAIESHTGQYHTIVMANNSQIILNSEQVKLKTKKLLEQYRIPAEKQFSHG